MNKSNFMHGFMGRIATVALFLFAVCGVAKAQEVLTADNVEIIAGKTAKVSISYSSEVERSGFQMTITLPEGLSFVGHDVDGESQVCTLGDATLSSHILSETLKGNVNNVVVMHLNKRGLKNGELLSFEVQAAKEFPEEADIVISKIKFNGGQNLDNMTVKVTRIPDPQVINDEAYAKLSAEVTELQKALTDALAGIAETCPGVKDKFTGTEISDSIAAVQTKLDEANKAVALTAESNIDENKAAINAAIEKLVADATAAQVEKNKQDANTAAYTKLSAEVAELRTALATALTGVAASCPDVKEQFTGAEISESITAIQTKLDEANTAVELTAESDINADKLAVNEAIQKLVADATAAQAAFVANDAAYTKLSAEVVELQKSLDAALANIAETCPGVKDEFAGTEIATSIAAVQTKLDAAHEAVELTAESNIEEDKAAVNAAIEKLVADAVLAQNIKDAKDANEAAYIKLSAEVVELQKSLDAALANIAETCPGVKDEFTGAEVSDSIAAVQTKLDAAHEAGELTAESNIEEEAAAINAAIEKLVADATEAQKVKDAKDANEAAYIKLGAEVAELQKSLDAALANIAETCPGVKDEFTGTEVSDSIAAVQAKLDAAHEAGELTAESNIEEEAAAINAAIEKLVADATAAQAALVLAEGTYYIRNVETGAFLVGGNSWGTQATAAKSGIDWNVTIADGKYMLDSKITNGGENHYLGANGFVDSNAKLNIVLVEDGVFSITTDEGFVLTAPAADAETTVVAFEENASGALTQWQFVTKEELDAELAEATEENVLDATYLIQDANFGRNDLRKEAWTMEASNQNLSGGNNTNNCAESYHSVFTLSQTISVPNGVYAVTAQGFYRQDGEDYDNLPYFFANDETASFFEMAGTENNMSDASASFTEGLYTIVPMIVEVTDGTLTIGAKNDVNESLWCIWDNFRLSYYGADADAEKIKNAVSINGVRDTAVKATAGIYSVSGVKLSEVQKGLNIIVGEDGTVRKVFVK